MAFLQLTAPNKIKIIVNMDNVVRCSAAGEVTHLHTTVTDKNGELIRIDVMEGPPHIMDLLKNAGEAVAP